MRLGRGGRAGLLGEGENKVRKQGYWKEIV